MKQPDKNKKISLDDLQNPSDQAEYINFLKQTAASGQEWAAIELHGMGESANIPDADASDLTSYLFSGPANVGVGATKALMALASTKKLGTLLGAAYKGKNLAAPVVKNMKQAARMTKSKQPFAMPAAVIPTAAKTAEKVVKAKPVQSAKVAKSYLERATEMAKTGASKLNPSNWSPTMKATTGLGALYAAYETFTSDDEDGVTDMIGFSNENKEVPKSKVTRNAKGELEYKKEMEMGGSIQHEGGVQKSITDRMSEYVGRDHADGGIKLKNSAIEVEGGEAEYADIPMANGGTSDYIFSDKINYGSGTFADKAKIMAKEGGSEEQIINLAKMQEAAARNKGEKGRNPDMIMEEGGLKKMVNGGPERKNLGNEGIAKQQPGLGGGYFGSADATMISEEEERKDFFNRNKTILGDLGIHSYQDYNPAKHAEMFQKKVNSHYTEKFENDEELRGELAKQGIADVDAYVKSVGFGGEGEKGLDFNHGEHHNSMTTEPKKPVEDKVINQDAGVTKSDSEEEEEEIVNEAPSNTFGNIANTAAIGMALNDKPDYVSTPGLVTPGAVVAGNQARVNLDRVDYSSQLATNSSDNVGMNKAIDQSGGGSSNMANRMAAFAAKKKADRQITSDQTNANTQIGNQEVGINSSIDAKNVANDMDASKTNASNILTASNANVSNAMRADEFNRGADAATFDRKLNAVETSAANINQIYRDKAQYASNERVAKAQSGKTGVYERELYENLLKKLNQNG